MKGLEKLTSIRLAEVLTDKEAVSTEAITDALYAQDQYGDPFAQVLVAQGQISEWDLAKLVTESFQLPFVMAGNYQLDEAVKERLPKELLFKHKLVPLDIFDAIVTVAMPILTPYEALAKIQKEHDVEIYPYVGLTSENRKVLTELYSDFSEFLIAEEQAREKRIADRKRHTDKSSGAEGGGDGDGSDWMSIFDAGDEAIRQSKPEEG